MTLEDLRAETIEFFKPTAPAPQALEEAVEAPARPRFSPFDGQAMGRVRALMEEFSRVAGGDSDQEAALRRVLDTAHARSETEDPELVAWALRLFITHDPQGSPLPIPSLETTAPWLLAPSAVPEEAALEAVGIPDETWLNWYRDDPWANQHHEHWHTVYSWSVGGKDREGEIFLYMHQQMLARYDTERIAAGLTPVVALDDYASELEGYDPGSILRDFDGRPFAKRPPGTRLSDVDGADTLAGWRDHAWNAVDAGEFDSDGGAHRLGTATEPSHDSPWLEWRQQNGQKFPVGDQLHNVGHGVLGMLPRIPRDRSAVITRVDTAIRDPVFYRWHRHIDNISARWQDRQGDRNDPSADPPPVVLRKNLDGADAPNASPDIVLALAKDLPEAADPDFDGAAWGEQHLGGAGWDQAFETGGPWTDTLTTRFDRTSFTHNNVDMPVKYLRHEPFLSFFRVENTSPEPRAVTFRVFLAATQLAEDRRMWIEMDKFSTEHPLEPGRHVIYRPGALSSVIRKSSMPPEPIERQPEDTQNSYCQCGWPYTLLLPSGTKNGMAFRLLVMLTDGAVDSTRGDEHCGSMSFCGLMDEQYPDTRAMGYPFDRPFAGGSIAETVSNQANMATRDITIRCENAELKEPRT